MGHFDSATVEERSFFLVHFVSWWFFFDGLPKDAESGEKSRRTWLVFRRYLSKVLNHTLEPSKGAGKPSEGCGHYFGS